MNIVKNKDMSQLWGTTERAMRAMKKDHLHKYELVELGSLCKANGLKKEDLINLIELKELMLKINK